MSVRFGRIIFFVLIVSNLVFCQNCGVPYNLELWSSEEIRRECADKNDVLMNISVSNVKSIAEVIYNPIGIQVELIEDHLITKVGSSLCSNLSLNEGGTYIDKTLSNSIQVQVKLKCADNRFKTVNIKTPLKDENTQAPYFKKSLYELMMEPCFIGSHNKTCPLNFESSILAIDQDRDEENAVMQFCTSEPDLIRVSSGKTEFYSNDSLMVIGRQNKVFLSLIQTNDTTGLKKSTFKPLKFHLFACNTVLSPNAERLCGNTTISVLFEKIDLNAPGNTLQPPVFNSLAYHAKVTSFGDIYFGAKLPVKPFRVYAAGMSEVKYVLQPPNDIFTIDSQTGRVFYSANFINGTAMDLTDGFKIFDIKAYLRYFEFDALFSTAPLLVEFRLHSGGNYTQPPPPDCWNTTVTPCHEWNQTVTEPTTVCPVVTCPATVPCNGSTTVEEGIGEDFTTLLPNPTEGNNVTSEPVVPTRPTTTELFLPTEYSTQRPITNSTWSYNLTTTTTTYSTTNDTTTTENYISTTAIPSQGECCGNCDIMPYNFTCPESLENFTNPVFPDPNDCSVYHICTSLPGYYDSARRCPEGLVYCPKFHMCMDEAECCEECQACQQEPSNQCLQPNQTGNHCTSEGYHPDPVYCDLFHQCVKDPYGFNSYSDCTNECAPGTIWCQELGRCAHEYGRGYDNCYCPEGKIKRPSRCQLCQPTNNRANRLWDILSRLIGKDGVAENFNLYQ